MTVHYRTLRREFPAAVVAIMLGVAAEFGVAPVQALRGTAVDEFALASPDTTVSLRDAMRILENCLQESAEPAFALIYGSRISLAALGPLGYALMSCADLEQLLGILMRYHRLLAGNFAISLSRERQGLVIALDGVSPGGPMHHDCEVFLAAAVSTLRKLMPGRLLGLRASFAYPQPEYLVAYQQLIGKELVFSASQTRLWLPVELLDTPMQFADPTMLRLYRQQCDALLAVGGGQAEFTEEVRRFLLTTPGRFPGIDGAASHFHMSARTLRRRLEQDGWTYQRIVHDLRRQLAETYLRDSMLSIAEIAQMLGYGDVSNFRRAFINWTGQSPAACRRSGRAEVRRG